MVQESAVARHDRMMREEMFQGDRARASAGKPADFWQTLARNFRPPAEAGDDDAPEVLARLIQASERVIDVGAGGGRIAIPLSRHCAELIAVEPSPSMRAVLGEEIARHGITNIQVVPETWERAEVQPAELVLAANVTYSIQSIEPFVRKLDARAIKHAAIIVLANPPQIAIAPFWKAVHGEERLRLPCRAEVVDVLLELGAKPEIVPLNPIPARPLGPVGEALDLLRFRLMVEPGTPRDARLQQVMKELAVERDGQLWPKYAPPNERSLLRWRPGRMR